MGERNQKKINEKKITTGGTIPKGSNAELRDEVANLK